MSRARLQDLAHNRTFIIYLHYKSSITPFSLICHSQKLYIISSDDEKFPGDVKIAEKSILIKKMIEDLNPDGLEEDFENSNTKCRSTVLSKVLEWCTHHKKLCVSRR